jgi:hypothetical protein
MTLLFSTVKSLAKRDFTFKTEKTAAQKKGKREYLNAKTKDFTKLNNYFETLVDIPRIKVGKRQTIETLINEEAMLFAKYFRREKKDWIPRVGIIESLLRSKLYSLFSN